MGKYIDKGKHLIYIHPITYSEYLLLKVK